MSDRLPRTRALVLKELRTVYVVTPKAMCTSMLWAVAELQGEDLDLTHWSRTSEVTRSLAVHDPALWRRTPLLHELPPGDVARVLDEPGWFRFALVRHPVDRLWSAWQSKLLLREPAYVERYGGAPWFPQLPEEVAGARDIAAQFEQFVSALEQDAELLTADQHWAPQQHLLRPDVFPYTALGHVETAGETLDLLRAHVRAHGLADLPPVGHHNGGLLPLATAGIGPSLLRRIERLYCADMATFGYASVRPGPAPAREVAAAKLQALAAVAARHERIGDLHRLVQGGRPGRVDRPVESPRPQTRSPRRRSRVSVVLAGAGALPELPAGVEGVTVVAAPAVGQHTSEGWRAVAAPRGLSVPARFAAGLAATSGDIVVLARDVTAVTAGWVDAVCDVLSDRDTGLVSAALEPAGSPGVLLAGLEIVDELLNCRWRPLPSHDRARPLTVPLVSSNFLAVRRATLDYLDGLDTGMRGDAWHDVDLSMRAWRCRFTSVMLPNVVARWRPAPGPTPPFVHDLLRFAAVHLDTPQFETLIRALRRHPGLSTDLGQVLVSDVGARRRRFTPLAQRPVTELLAAIADAGPERGRRAS